MPKENRKVYPTFTKADKQLTQKHLRAKKKHQKTGKEAPKLTHA
jgi:hypothetical protein